MRGLSEWRLIECIIFILFSLNVPLVWSYPFFFLDIHSNCNLEKILLLSVAMSCDASLALLKWWLSPKKKCSIQIYALDLVHQVTKNEVGLR